MCVIDRIPQKCASWPGYNTNVRHRQDTAELYVIAMAKFADVHAGVEERISTLMAFSRWNSYRDSRPGSSLEVWHL